MKRFPLLCLVIFVGCSAGDRTTSDQNKGTGKRIVDIHPAEDGPQGKGKPWDASKGTATVRGVVNFIGKPPRRRSIDMSSTPECAKVHSSPVFDESVIVNPDGTLLNVFVWVKRGLNEWEFSTSSEPVVLDQNGCVFRPHVVGVQTGQPITFRNSDPFPHNVHAMPNRNTGFNFTQTKNGMEDQRHFSRPEVMVKVKCDVHGWMTSWIGVVRHPYFVTTGKDGTFEFAKLPPGEYTIEAWHEKFDTQTQKVTLADNESKVIEFSFEGK